MIGQLTTNQPFALKLTLDCGQGHRWLLEKDGKGKSTGWYSSVLCNELMRIRQVGGPNKPVEYEYETEEEQPRVEAMLRWQFRLRDDDEDVGEVYTQLERDSQMKALVSRYRGLRVMRVDPWECLVFFTLTGNTTTIEQTHAYMEKLAEEFGNPIGTDCSFRYSFPDAAALVKRGQPELENLYKRLGMLVSSPKSVAQQVLACGIVLGALPGMSYQAAIRSLISLYQVADKKANCVALFSLGKLDAFPVDQHIYRSLHHLYGTVAGFPEKKPPYTPTLRKKAQMRFGRYAGYASQFLFIWDLKGQPKLS